MGMDVDREVRILLADGSDQQGSRMGFQDPSHIFDTKNVNVKSNKFVNKAQVVLEVVLLLGVLIRESVLLNMILKR
jgi:hypothetical protein